MSTEFDHTSMVLDCVTKMLNTYTSGMSEAQFFSANIIDSSSVTEQMMHEQNDGVVEYCMANGCLAALPPFERGSYVDFGERRFISWEVLEVAEDYFRISLEHYPILFADLDNSVSLAAQARSLSRSWYLASRMIVRVKVLTDKEHQEMISHHPDYVNYRNLNSPELLRKLSAQLKSPYYVGGVLESYEYFLPHDLQKIRKKGKYETSSGEFVNGTWVRDLIDEALTDHVDNALHNMTFVSLGPLFEMFTYINYMLSQKATPATTHRKVSSAYMLNPEITDLRKERHFGTIKFVSENKPRAVNAANIQRIYTTAAWQRRGHLRHLASGKIVPVKPATCHRQGLGDALAPQVVYTV